MSALASVKTKAEKEHDRKLKAKDSIAYFMAKNNYADLEMEFAERFQEEGHQTLGKFRKEIKNADPLYSLIVLDNDGEASKIYDFIGDLFNIYIDMDKEVLTAAECKARIAQHKAMKEGRFKIVESSQESSQDSQSSVEACDNCGNTNPNDLLGGCVNCSTQSLCQNFECSVQDKITGDVYCLDCVENSHKKDR